MEAETTLNIQNAVANFNRDYVNFRKIDHDFKFAQLPKLEAEANTFMQRAFKQYAAGKDSAGDVYARLAEYFFIQAQLLKNFKPAESKRVQIASKIKPFNS